MTEVLERPRLLPTPPIPQKLLHHIWAECGFNPHPLQRAILLDRTRNRVESAGRRAGKSMIGGYLLVPEVFRAQAELEELRRRNLRREYWIVGPEYSDAEKEFRIVWGALERLGFPLDHPGSYNNPESGEMQISMFGRRLVIAAKSAKYPGTLVGEGLSGVVFSEAAKLKPSIFNKFIRPTLADFGGWTFMGSTPEGRNWFYDFWSTGQDDSRGDWKSWRSPSWSNPHVYSVGCDEELLRTAREMASKGQLDEFMRSVKTIQADMGLIPVGIDPEIWSLFMDMSHEMFGQEVAAEFNEFVGRVFKDFDEETHLSNQELREDWNTYACVDYGFTNPFVWLLLQVDPHGERVHVVNEYYESGRTTEEAAAEIEARGLHPPNNGPFRIIKFYPDPAEPDRTRELEQRLHIKHGGAQTPRADRIEWIRRKLKAGPAHLPLGHPERLPYLTFHRRCKHAIREMGIWKYPDAAKAADRGRSAPEEPESKDNHCPEALGRFMSGFFGDPWAEKRARGAGRVRVGRSRVGR